MHSVSRNQTEEDVPDDIFQKKKAEIKQTHELFTAYVLSHISLEYYPLNGLVMLLMFCTLKGSSATLDLVKKRM